MTPPTGTVDYLKDKLFSFECEADYKFQVVSFTGSEGLSELFEFDITLTCPDDETIDFDKMLLRPATLHLWSENSMPIIGVIAGLEQLSPQFYRVLLVPEAWKLTLDKRDRHFYRLTIKKIFEQIAGDHGVSLEVKGKRAYRDWTHVTQFEETDFDFISRWMEREGIYYFFDHDHQGKLVMVDDKIAHADALDPNHSPLTLFYNDPSGLALHDQELLVKSFVRRQRPVPHKVFLHDHDYREGNELISAEAVVDSKGEGEVWIYGEHFKPDEIHDLAQVRAEEIACRKKIYSGQSESPFLRSGCFVTLDGHFRTDHNAKYLVTRIRHEGSQAAFFAAGEGGSEEDSRPFYRNSFEAIESDVQYRPERRTPKPRVYGAMNAKIVGQSQDYPSIDKYGRYKVAISYDTSGAKELSQRSMRLATPYTGPQYGFHFPLHVNTDVILTFIEGDVDRPIITGAVYSAENKNVLVDEDNDKNRLRTKQDNLLEMGDNMGNEYILLSTPTKEAKTTLRIGKELELKDQEKCGCELITEANSIIDIGNDATETIGHDSKLTIKNDFTSEVQNNHTETVKNDHKHKVENNHTQEVMGNQQRTIQKDQKITINGKQEIKVMADRQVKIMANDELTVAADQKQTVMGNSSRTVMGKDDLTVSAAQDIKIMGGRTITNLAKESRTVMGPVTITNSANVNETNMGMATVMYMAMAQIQFMAMVQITQMGMAMETNNGTLMQTRNVKIEKCNAMEMTSGSMKLKSNQMEIVTNSMTIVS